MTTRTPKKARKTFTVEEGNASLPLVRAIVQDLVDRSRDIAERRERLLRLQGGRRRDVKDFYSEEVAEIEQQLDRDTEGLQEYIEELHDLGVEPKSLTEGLVDFPAVLNGRPVYLCWKLGEAKITHWHGRDEGFDARKPLA